MRMLRIVICQCMHMKTYKHMYMHVGISVYSSPIHAT